MQNAGRMAGPAGVPAGHGPSDQVEG